MGKELSAQDKDLQASIMSDLFGEKEEAEVETAAEEAEVEDTTTEEEAEVTEDEQETEVEGEEEEITSEPASNKEVNKMDAIKALRAKLNEVTNELKGVKAEAANNAEAKSESDLTLEAIAASIGKTPQELKAALRQKEAEKQGMNLETLDKIENLQKQLNEVLAEKTKSEETAKHNSLVKTIDEFVEEVGLTKEEDVKEFFRLAKEEYGMDFVKNPNLKAMKALFNGGLADNFKDRIEQETLLKIKQGQSVDVKSQPEENVKVKQAKKQKEQEELDYDRWSKLASKRSS